MMEREHPRGTHYRVWEPVTAHSDVAYLNDRTRVQRWHVARAVSHTARIYQVQILKQDRWIPISPELQHADAAWSRAEKIVNKQRRVSAA